MLRELHRLLRELKSLALAAFNSKAAWALAIYKCIQETTDAFIAGPYEGVAVGILCFGKLLLVAHELNAPQPVVRTLRQVVHTLQVLQLQQGGNRMACVTTHKVSQTAQGPGVCCAALGASGQTPVVGLRIAATDAKGHCFVCEVKSSTSKKNPGALVFKRGKSHVPGSAVSCPTSTGGCCSLAAA